MRQLLRALLFPALVVPAACTDSSSSAPTALDPPRLSIDGVHAAGASDNCLQPGTDPRGTVVVNVGPNDGAGPSGTGGHLLSPGTTPVSWTLSPPLSCSGTPPCGFLVLTVYRCTSLDLASCDGPPSAPLVTVAAASTSIPVQMRDITDPTGFFRFHVELVNQDGTAAVDAAGKTHPADVVKEVRARCGMGPGPKPDAGKDATPGDAVAPPHDAGAPDAGAPMPDATPPPDATPIPDARPDVTIPVDAPVGQPPDAGNPPPDAAPVVPDATPTD